MRPRPWLHLQRRRFRPQRSRGAALLLVLFIVPALSLLGTALLSQTTLEGDRVLAQLEDMQSWYYAEAGLDRAVWALEQTGQLQTPGQSLPAGVFAASATQGGVSTGALDWWGGAVTISATGQSGRSKRTLSAQYTPDPSGSGINLKNVITSGGLITIASPNPPAVCSYVNGPVVTGNASTDLSSVLGTHPVTVTPVPPLDISAAIAFVKAHYSWTTVTSAQIDASTPTNPFQFTGGASTPAVYYTNDPGLYVPTTGNNPSCVRVQNECIWLIENGVNLSKTFEIVGAGYTDKLLVLIAEDPSSTRGFWTDKTVMTDDVTVMVLSDGYMHFGKESTLVAVSLYTSDYFDATKGQDFGYVPAALDSWIDSLDERGLIPRIVGTTPTGTLSMAAGSLSQTYGP